MGQQDFDTFKSHPLTIAAFGAIALFCWNSFSEGRKSGETYATIGYVNAAREQDRAYEKEQHDMIVASLKDFSNRNHDDMEKKQLASEAKFGQALAELKSTIQLLDQKMTQLMDWSARAKK